MASHTEVEIKFDAPVEGSLPDLSGVCAAVSEPAEVRLEATYFDTEDLRLARRRLMLRRRTGGDDAGWHLKLPVSAEERIELRRPLGRATAKAPKPLVDEVRAIVRDRPLTPIAVLATRRVERQLLDEQGRGLAVVSDDTVRAERLVGEPTTTSWREVEVELLEGDRGVLEGVSRRLREGGLRRSGAPSKLVRALGEAVDQAGLLAADGRKEQTAGEVLWRHLDQQVTELLARDRAARSDEPDGVHKMRVATRRLRSAMATYRPVLQRSQTDTIRAELKWLGQQLGESCRGGAQESDADLPARPARRRSAAPRPR